MNPHLLSGQLLSVSCVLQRGNKIHYWATNIKKLLYNVSCVTCTCSTCKTITLRYVCVNQRWQQVIFCKSKSSDKSFGQTSSQVTSHLVQTQVKSQVSLSKYKSSRTLFCPAVISNQGQASHQSTVSYSQRYMKWSMVLNNFY